MANKGKERGTFSYLYEWARPYRSRYLLSVLFAVCEVGFGIVPFVCLGKIRNCSSRASLRSRSELTVCGC